MKNVLVAGGTGYLGGRLCRHLAERGHQITVLGRYDPTDTYPDWTRAMHEVVIGDIRAPETFKAIAHRQFHAIINLISLDHTKSEAPPEQVFSINTLPTWRLLEHFADLGLERFIYFSTQQVLGPLLPTDIDEEFRPRPVNKYGLTHLLSEQVVDYYSRTRGITGINLRLSNGYGSPVFSTSRCWQYVVMELCQMAFSRQEMRLLSDGSPLRDFVDLEDVCRCVDALLTADQVDTLYHLASGKTYPILEVAHLIQRLYHQRFGAMVPVILSDGTVSTNPNIYRETPRFRISPARISRLGVTPTQNMQRGVTEIFDYLSALSELGE